MNYTIACNSQFGSIEIAFDEKPAQRVRDALKALRFRWHGVKKVWYGYTDEMTVRAAIDGTAAPAAAARPAAKSAESKPAANKYGVKVGDIFYSSWGYEQTNVNFFQVVALCGTSSVRVREVYPRMDSERAVSPMSADRTYSITRDMLPPADRSVFIKNQERGDIKRLKSFAADGVSNPQFNLTTYANAYLCTDAQLTTYESWYA